MDSAMKKCLNYRLLKCLPWEEFETYFVGTCVRVQMCEWTGAYGGRQMSSLIVFSLFSETGYLYEPGDD